ncbi:GTP-binding protein Era [Orientia chuto str. Dubai]|uniref:GTPase Era n=1 Tax=Orientia chuto str. Dubai TaxID=1359168 RepID=A0A0F3MIX4_9RICK|nr:GTPase Era [Candidatus Orientia mediorientalis]KJV55586.1 GTP-binding protein Era [Orientia chuto str. Dubai]
MKEQNKTAQQKTIVVSILGMPNSGKSTLLNRLIGHKISIVTPKVQTTRSAITGIVTYNFTQLIFIDTPGIFQPKKTLEKAMVRCAWTSIVGADLALLMIDITKKLNEQIQIILTRLISQKIKFCIILNKIDVGVSNLTQLKNDLKRFNVKIIVISALNGDGVQNLLQYIVDIAPIKPWLYDEDNITTASMKFLAQEITREQLFLALHQELPYNITVEHERWEQLKDGSVKIFQAIVANKSNYKAIILGKAGSKISIIGQKARLAMQKAFSLKICLILFVKIRPSWDQEYTFYENMGLKLIKS